MPSRSRQLTDVTSRYLACFGEIEGQLRKLLHVGPEEHFAGMIDMCRRRGLMSSRECDTLDRFRRVRNALSHNGIGTDVSPTGDALSEIERFLNRLSHTPPVGELFRRDVTTFQTGHTVVKVVQAMRQQDYSHRCQFTRERNSLDCLQPPPSHAGFYEFEQKGGVLDDALVNDALAHTEFPENYRFLGRDVPALETPSMFQEALAHGAPIDALLITQSGKPTESLLGIVTPADLPRILPGE